MGVNFGVNIGVKKITVKKGKSFRVTKFCDVKKFWRKKTIGVNWCTNWGKKQLD